jgi:hypothetical protein
MNYTITLTETEDLALSYAALDQQDWINNAVHERCRVAIDEIVQYTVQKCLDANISIPSTRDDIVALAFSQGWVLTGAQRNQLSSQNQPG